MRNRVQFVILFLLLAAGAALAQTTPPPAPDVGNWLSDLLNAIVARNWWVVAAVALTAIVWVIRRYVLGSVAFFGTTFGGWLMNFGLAFLTGMAVSFAAGKHSGSDILDVLIAVFKVGAASSTIYTAVQDVTGGSSKPAAATA